MLARLVLGFLALTLLAANASAAEGPSSGQDLKAAIALQGLPCDQVINSKRNGDSDYTATCKDGNRYHIFVDSTGRVVVKKL
jgi:hypothetical protein